MSLPWTAMKVSTHVAPAPPKKNDAGMSLLELLIAMSILAVGVSSLSVLFIFASETNNKNSKATSSTMLAQQVLEQIEEISSDFKLVQLQTNAQIAKRDSAHVQR